MTNRYLPTALRRALEKTVKDARLIAEEGARDAIRRLGVADGKAPSFLNENEKDLRHHLRAHARALGDAFDRSDETHETKRLIEAAAYAHWHRMLFARFLAERGLLRNPEYDVPVSLENCRELAEAEGLADPWIIAERYAASMLPAVFRIDDPVLSIELDPVQTQKLHRLVTGLDDDVFQAEDSLGWTYQFWRAAEKNAVNKSGVKIGADELPAVTQLFTEPYMVRFLLHNTLGAWWAGKVLAADPSLAKTAADEDALRAACSLPGYSFDMLRFVREGEDSPWRPAAGTFPGWPTEAKAITVLDPCCGSGHFLTESLATLAALRRAKEHLSAGEAVAAVLRDNLNGLEIDGRCVQIAAFAVALTAWRIGGWQALPLPHIAWVGAPPPLPKQEFVALADGNAELEYALAPLHDLFAQAPVLGSLLDTTPSNLFEVEKMGVIERLLEPLLARVRKTEPERLEGVVAARGMAESVTLLRKRYVFTATNFPFLTQLKFAEQLNEFVARQYDKEKGNLATCMISKSLSLCIDGGSIAFVAPQSWWFLKRYRGFRDHVFQKSQVLLAARLGENAFWSQGAGGELVGLTLLSRCNPKSKDKYVTMDISADTKHERKENNLTNCHATFLPLDIIRQDPQRYLHIEKTTENSSKLGDFVTILRGVSTGDSPRFVRSIWEVYPRCQDWEYHQTTTSEYKDFAGMTEIIFWQKENGELARFADEVKHLNHAAQNWRRGRPNWGRQGVVVSQMGSFPGSIYTGAIYDPNCCAIVPENPEHIPAIWKFCRSGQLAKAVRRINQNRKVEVGTFLATDFDLSKLKSIIGEKDVRGLPAPYSSDCTQWLFHGHSADSTKGTAIHVAIARLCGYRWPAETDPDIHLSDEARAWIAKAAALPPGDNDGLVGLSAVAGQKPLADRLRAYLAVAFGADWSDALERRLVAEADETLDKKTARDGSLEAWVRDRAFRQHCALFGQRPFLWHISDGLKGGFSALVHYHRFDQANLRKLTYTLLGDWLARANAENNALRYEKGRELQQKLEKILEGEKPYDIFVRWRSLAQQPLGWDPYLDDGVRQNIRPFVIAGVLTHDLSKILKDKDRGRDVSSAPWYDVFNGERRNDHHTTLAEKRAARESAGKRVEAAK